MRNDGLQISENYDTVKARRERSWNCDNLRTSVHQSGTLIGGYLMQLRARRIVDDFEAEFWEGRASLLIWIPAFIYLINLMIVTL